MSSSQSNSLLDALSPDSRKRILSVSRAVILPVRTPLIETGEQVEYAYFITSGIASVVIELEEGGSAEVALIGREGVVGALELLGPALAPSRCFVQVAATAYRLYFSELKKMFRDSEEIRTRILEYVQQQSMTMSQLVACNKLHDAEPRLARWLLMVQDRVQDETLGLTQEFLARMLGTQRTTVVAITGALQRRGIIAHNRGKVRILSRQELERAACDCYQVVHALHASLYQTSA